MKLVAEASNVVARFTDGVYGGGGVDALRGDLANLIRTLLQSAATAEVALGEAALENMAKRQDRWPRQRHYPALPDDDLHVDEQLPRTMRVLIYEREVNSTKFVFQKVGSILLGDRLTDNHEPPDDYRFHDVFHLAHATVLGWSPTTRALFRVKRKSQKTVDENEDGARAILIYMEIGRASCRERV